MVCIRVKCFWSFALCFMLLMSLEGCAVLTQSQVGEVSKFANAAKNYSDLPGAVMTAHTDLRTKRVLLRVTTVTDGKNSITAIQDNIDFNKRIMDRAKGANEALGVLKNYADLLVQLTSDTYTNSLQGSAESLGTEIDNGIRAYNNATNSNLSTFGSYVAAAVRGLGGLYIKHEQTKALKEAVEKADPVINKMITNVERLLFLYFTEDEAKNFAKELKIELPKDTKTDGLITSEVNQIKDIYTTIVPRYGGKQPLDVVTYVTTGMIAGDEDLQLAKKTIKAAEAYRDAHSKLAENLKNKEDIATMIKEVQVLVDEVKAAQALKKKLDQK